MYYLNNNEGYLFQPHNNIPSYYHSGWRTYEDFCYGNSSFQSQESLSFNYQGKILQPSFEEKILALLDETKKENDAQEKRLSNLEENHENINATLKSLETQIRQLPLATNEKYSRPLLNDIEDDEIRECDIVPLSFEEELLGLTLVEEKENEFAIEEESLLKRMKVEKKHPEIIVENVLLGVEKINFPIDFVTWAMEDDRQVSSIGRPSFATSQVWIDVEHGEMTLLIGEEKEKFDLLQSMPLTNEQRRMCTGIESLLLPIEEHAPIFLQEYTLEGFEFMANSLSTKELAFELISHIMEVEKFILMSD